MRNLSSKQVQDIQSLYEGIYEEVQETAETVETISEEDFCDILSIEICNALIKEGLLEGEIITETTIKEGKLGTAWNVATGLIKPVIKQVTGLGTKPTTALGQKVRTAQKIGVVGGALYNPMGALNTVTGAIGGAVKGAYQGATQPGGGLIDAASRAIQAAQGKAVPAADDKKKNNGSGTTTWSTTR
jgi:hypothetical protein